MNTTQIASLAAEAIQCEGVVSYFGDLEISSSEAASVLAEWMERNPESWSPAGKDGSWSISVREDDLAALAAELGYVA